MISEFRGQHRWLSNFWLDADGKSVEHYFQAAKTLNPQQKQWVLDSDTPGEAKRRGREIALREDWAKIKIQVMTELVRKKFFDSEQLAAKLLATGNEELVEGNTWGDVFWGWDINKKKGSNHLGIILMKIREELRTDTLF